MSDDLMTWGGLFFLLALASGGAAVAWMMAFEVYDWWKNHRGGGR